MADGEWNQFRVGTPSTRPDWTEPDCVPLTHVGHVAHVGDAWRIVEDQQLRANLIGDESKLRDSRTQVVWLSPNSWSNGSRYGNVQFNYPWADLIRDHRAYWVEAMAYGNPASRILLTTKNYDNSLVPYDPSQRHGPWWHDSTSGRHYWNSKYTLEVMLEENLPLSRCARISFTDHHEYQCCIAPRSCPDRRSSESEGGARFVAGVAGRRLPTQMDIIHPQLTVPFSTHQIERSFAVLREAIARFANGSNGQLTTEHQSAPSIARALLRAHAERSVPDVRRLAGLFANSRSSIDACGLVIVNSISSITLEQFDPFRQQRQDA